MNSKLIESIFLTSTMDSPIPNMNIEDASSGVVNISEAIYKYGPAVVIAAVFFVIFMILIVIMLYNNTRMINQMMNSKVDSDKQDQALLSKLIENIMATGNKKDNTETLVNAVSELKDTLIDKIDHLEDGVHKDEEPKGDDYHKDIVGAYIDINMAFKDISRQTLNDLQCDRIAIYVFHNGNQSMYGLPFFKMSCIHEWTKHGSNTSLRGKSHSDMPLHLFNDFLEDLYKNGYYKAENIDNAMVEDNSIREFTALTDSKALYLIAVNDMYGSLIGFVDAEFHNVETFESDENRDAYIREKMEYMISKISPIIGNKYIYKKE